MHGTQITAHPATSSTAITTRYLTAVPDGYPQVATHPGGILAVVHEAHGLGQTANTAKTPTPPWQ
jgi:hypothetical protein